MKFILSLLVVFVFGNNTVFAQKSEGRLDLFISAGLGPANEYGQKPYEQFRYLDAGFKFVQSWKRYYLNIGAYSSGFTLNIPIGGGLNYKFKKSVLQLGGDLGPSIDYFKEITYLSLSPGGGFMFKLGTGTYVGILLRATFPVLVSHPEITKYYSFGFMVRF